MPSVRTHLLEPFEQSPAPVTLTAHKRCFFNLCGQQGCQSSSDTIFQADEKVLPGFFVSGLAVMLRGLCSVHGQVFQLPQFFSLRMAVLSFRPPERYRLARKEWFVKVPCLRRPTLIDDGFAQGVLLLDFHVIKNPPDLFTKPQSLFTGRAAPRALWLGVVLGVPLYSSPYAGAPYFHALPPPLQWTHLTFSVLIRG